MSICNGVMFPLPLLCLCRMCNGLCILVGVIVFDYSLKISLIVSCI